MPELNLLSFRLLKQEYDAHEIAKRPRLIDALFSSPFAILSDGERPHKYPNNMTHFG